MSKEPRSKEWELWSRIVARAWQDESFKRRLLAEPADVVKEQGLEVPTGVQLRLVEKPGPILELAFSPEGLAAELSEKELSTVTGGGVRVHAATRHAAHADIPRSARRCPSCA